MSLQDIPFNYKINLKKKSINATLIDIIFLYAQNHYQRKAKEKGATKKRLTKDEKEVQQLNPGLKVNGIWQHNDI